MMQKRLQVSIIIESRHTVIEEIIIFSYQGMILKKMILLNTIFKRCPSAG